MITPIQYTAVEQTEIETFKVLSDSEMRGYWEKTHEGELASLKERIKTHYLETQDYTCPYCRQRIVVSHLATWDAEHIIPKDTHPRFMFEAQNLCVACKDCNLEKLNKNVLINSSRRTFPKTSSDYLISHPHFDDYEANIKVISVAGFYLPKTDKGRKTVEICGLLRFLYELANYEAGSEETGQLLGQLVAELMSSKDGAARNFLLEAISDIAQKGARKQRDSLMAQRFPSGGATAV
jgi:hypothetical protein